VKKVFSSPSLWEATEIVALLVQNGVEARLLNEHVAGTPGILPFNAMMAVDAEVWILDTEFAGRAARLIAEFQAACAAGAAARADTPDWRCERCGETNPPGFETCWACGARAWT
jgi:hypothetical protein